MSLKSKYNEEQIKAMDILEFLREATFEDIYYSIRLLKVARYARESTKHEDQVMALENQVERLDTFIERNNMYLMEEKHKYTEHGGSGRTTKDRTAFNLMIEAAKRREFNVIIVQDVCRFARNLKDLLIYIDILKNYEIGVLILDGNYWTFNMSDTDIIRLAVDGGMAQGESMRTSKRVANGVQSYRERGQLVVSKVFGYELKKTVNRRDNTLTIHPVNGLTVKKIFELYTHPDANKRMGSGKIANYLNAHGFKTDAGNLTWTASKVNRVLKNEKYMGYMMYGKFKVVDPMQKKKIATKIKPVREDVYDKDGNLIKKCNLVKGDWEPLVSEEVWWLANEIQKKRAAYYINSPRGNILNGLRESVDVIANKSFCQCGYSCSPQYVHTAKNGKEAQFRYKCRWQINEKTPEYRKSHNLPMLEHVCTVDAVSDMKMWLMSLKVFSYLFGDCKEEILTTLQVIEESKREADAFKSESKTTLGELEEKLETVQKQLDNMYLDKLSGEIDVNEYKRLSKKLKEERETIERGIADRQSEEARDEKIFFDLQYIEKQLNTFVDFSGKKVSDELIDMFVERIIFRSNDEFVWEMNLSGARSDSYQYRIREYSEEYAKQLQSDENFNIVYSFMIPLEECRKFVEEKVGRRFVEKFWRPITVKIAVK